jgi:NAD(P)-dependent dehydrogenase (short-subunit alcohol dehydrogenase family)
MAGRLQGKACIVTGGAQGIGAAYARALAAEGADVAVVDLKRIDQAAELGAEVQAMGRRFLALKADVSDPHDMLQMARSVVERFGRIDCLVNNAALMFDQLTATWDDFLAVNFMGILHASNAVVPYLWEQRHGSIINISSTAAFPLPMPPEYTPSADGPAPRIDVEGYGMTKWMIIHQTRRMARMLGPRNLRVNAVCPGLTMSPAAKAVVPGNVVETLKEAAALRTTLEPQDMTGVVLFLASDESSKMTGQVLINDAGTWFSG